MSCRCVLPKGFGRRRKERRMPKCQREDCGFEGSADDFHPCFGVYHDMRCPECGTTEVDTEDIFEEWATEGRKYGYGKHNTLDTKG